MNAPVSAAASRPAGASPADWSALGRGLAGKLVRPGDADYATARGLFNPRFDATRPAGIAYCDNPADVAACLAFVQRFGVAVTPRGGGHSYAGYSTGPGLVVDVTRMNSVTVPSSGTARVGAGTRLVELYAALGAHGATVPGGSCPTVGVAGLVLGGGLGVVSRAYGTLSDNLTSVQIVTADGRVRECSADRDADLFWACRGGGGGNFGVATAFTFGTHPAGALVLFFLSWPWSAAPEVINGWQAWAPKAPDALWSNLHALSSDRAAPTIQVGGTYLGSQSDAEAQLSRLVAQVGSSPSGSPFVTSYNHAMMIEAGCAQLSVPQCHLPSQDPHGRLARESEFAKSHVITDPLPTSGISAIVHAVEQRQAQLGGGGRGGVAFDALGGAVNRVSADSTAFVHRNGLFLAQFTTTWGTQATANEVGRQEDWLRTFHQAMAPFASGQAYQNYTDPELGGYRQAYYGANYARLLQVKRAYDPSGVFTSPQGIS